MNKILLLTFTILFPNLTSAQERNVATNNGSTVKYCGTSPCHVLSDSVHAVVGKVSVLRPTRETFRPFKAGSSMPDILRAAGVPSKNVGSGTFAFVWEFENGKSCTVGAKDLQDQALYINCE